MATEAANRAMAIAERGMFLFHRMPFLWRLQVRLGTRELFDDALTRLRTGLGSASFARLARRGATYAVLLLGVVTVAGLRAHRRRGG